MNIESKLAHVGTNIFSVMSGMARKYDAINLAQGFPNFDSPSRLKELVNKYLHSNFNQYAPMLGVDSLRSTIADKIASLYQKKLDINSEICITSGASEAIFTAILALVPKNSEVIVIEPCYDSYEPSIRLAGAKAIPYVLSGPDFKINWQDLSLLINEKTSMIIVNTPHNPTGKILQAEDLKQLDHITKNTNIIILSDEVYEHLVYDGHKHLSLVGHESLFQRTIAVFSFGKTFHCTGWKIGYCIAPESIMKEFVKVHQFNVFCVPHFIQHALAEYLSDENSYNYLANFYQEKRDLFQSIMNKSSFKALETEGSFFQLYDYSAISQADDMAFSTELTKKNGVACIPISSFYSQAPNSNYVRFCFAKTEETLEMAGKRLAIL